jgi:iron complex outermembrane receptor protein
MKQITFHAIAIGLTVLVTSVSGEPASNERPWFQLSLEELLQVEVFSASRTQESYLESPSPITVMTHHDLASGPFFQLMDALRVEPGVQVFNVNNGRWMLGVRGFETNHSNQTLVLKDGRSLNIPTLNGIYWSELDYPVDEIEQVEVVRGPGGSVWGSNAVNGVINILSRQARQTQGWFAEATAGNEMESGYYLRYGGKLNWGDDTYYRASFSGSHWGASRPVAGKALNDEVNSLKGGFRLDHDSADKDTVFSLKAEVFQQDFSERMRILNPLDGKIFLQDVRNEDSGLTLQADLTHYRDYDETVQLTTYVELFERNMIPFTGIDTRVFDLQYAHTITDRGRHCYFWTAEYRLIEEEISDSFTFDFPDHLTQRHLATLSLQDAWELVPERLKWTNTVKGEYHTYTGSDVLITSRLAFTPGPRSLYWVSAARGLRQPSRVEHDATLRLPVQVNPRLTVLSEIRNNDELEPEQSWSFQAGSRRHLSDSTLLDLTLFYNHYSGLINADVASGPTFPYRAPTFVSRFENNRDGSTFGSELALEWNPSAAWRLRGNVSWMKFDLERTPATNQLDHVRVFANLMLEWRPVEAFSGSVTLRRVERVISNNLSFAAYTEMDARVDWRLGPAWEFSLIGRNLLQPSHLEYTSFYTYFEATEVERSAVLQARFRF